MQTSDLLRRQRRVLGEPGRLAARGLYVTSRGGVTWRDMRSQTTTPHVALEYTFAGLGAAAGSFVALRGTEWDSELGVAWAACRATVLPP